MFSQRRGRCLGPEPWWLFRMLSECGKATRFRQNKTGGQEAEKAAPAPEGERTDGEQPHTEAGAANEGHRPNQSVSPHVEATLMRGDEVGQQGGAGGPVELSGQPGEAGEQDNQRQAAGLGVQRAGR